MENSTLPLTVLPPNPFDSVPVAEVIPFPSPLFEYSVARERIDKYISDWSVARDEAALRRKERYQDISVEGLRESGDIQEDETFIPDRLVDSNINRDSADTLGFLNAGFRLAVFDCLSNPSIDCRQQEIEFTKGLTYDGWYPEFAAWEDGAQLHGMSYIEVIYDEKRPLHVGFEYIPYDKLFYNKNVRDIQQSELLVREYSVNIFTLEKWAKKYSFDPVQISNITNSNTEKARDREIKIYKIYLQADAVYEAWYCKETEASDWLLKPRPKMVGMIDKDTQELIPSAIYPIFTRLYKPDENEVLVEHKGRGFLDQPQQEANTYIITSYVNNLFRSSNFYASPDGDDDNAEMKELDINLSPGAVMNRKLNFWSIPQPDVSTLQALTFLDSRQAAMNGKTAFTVVNRKDSRKTKKELDLAEGQENKITNTTLANFSATLRSVLNYAWSIVQSQALLQTIRFLQVTAPETGSRINNIPIIALDYDLRPAGETDILQAEVETQKMMLDWPVIANTSLAPKFLQDFIKLRYPTKASEYVQILIQGNPAKQLVAGLLATAQGAMQANPEIQALPPEKMQEAQNLFNSAQQYLQNPAV